LTARRAVGTTQVVPIEHASNGDLPYGAVLIRVQWLALGARSDRRKPRYSKASDAPRAAAM